MSKINLLYFKNLLDIAMTRFVTEHNNMFVREGDKYIFAVDYDQAKLKKIFRFYITDELKKYITPFDLIDPNYYFIIGACFPQNNLLLKFKGDCYVPAKVLDTIRMNYPIKYYMKEKDIIMDMIRMNQVFVELFDEFFSNTKTVRKMFGKDYTNVFFIQNSVLDCYSLFKIIKGMYGNSSCVNIHKEMMTDIKHPIGSINETLCNYINNKREFLDSEEFKRTKASVMEYITDCIRSV